MARRWLTVAIFTAALSVSAQQTALAQWGDALLNAKRVTAYPTSGQCRWLDYSVYVTSATGPNFDATVATWRWRNGAWRVVSSYEEYRGYSTGRWSRLAAAAYVCDRHKYKVRIQVHAYWQTFSPTTQVWNKHAVGGDAHRWIFQL